MAQIKFVVADDLAERFKRAVLKKHGKLSLSAEGAKALQLYLDQPSSVSAKDAGPDPLLGAIGAATSKGTRPNALQDKHGLYGA
ncbi:MAG: hypothetical protein WC876_00490 [Candidatus Thermoplasmatota archaeon]|jgi:hypothetical protein